jgi:transcriptional regulator with XRE-family HTH domain
VVEPGDVENLADRLKARRQALGISQSQAARELEVARTAYRLWEMEAARPAPDRWRLVARWLGVSVTTLLLSEGYISEEEAAELNVAADTYETATGGTQDLATEGESGDFFEQGETVIDESLEKGIFTAKEAAEFRKMLKRIEKGLSKPE